MDWISLKQKSPDLIMKTLITIKDLHTGETGVIACSWNQLVDPETGEILSRRTFTYDGTQDFNDGKEFRVLAWMPLPEPYPDYFRVIVAGSRSFDDYSLLKDKLDKVFELRKPTSIVCGEEKGADKLGRKYAEENHIPLDSFPADWGKKGKQAGYIRNEQMADNAEALIAFWDGKSSGTKHMIETAREKGLQIRVIRFSKE